MDLSFSRLRENTTLIANISAKDADVSHEGLQKAVDNLARMYSDTISLSSRAGDTEACVLPMSADIREFGKANESSLSSFQSSLVDSLQLSLTSSPRSLHLTPLSEDTVPIIPHLLRAPKSSTPNNASANNVLVSPLSSNTVEMKTVEEISWPDDLMRSYEAMDILNIPTLRLMNGPLQISRLTPPAVSTDDLSFFNAARALNTNPPSTPTPVSSPRPTPSPSPSFHSIPLNTSTLPEYNESYEKHISCCSECDNVSDPSSSNSLLSTMSLFPLITSPLPSPTLPARHHYSDTMVNTLVPTHAFSSPDPDTEPAEQNNDGNGYVTYETLSELYGNLDYDDDSADDDDYF